MESRGVGDQKIVVDEDRIHAHLKELLRPRGIAGEEHVDAQASGGFGGSCCLLVDPKAADKIVAAITADYKAAYGDEPTCALIEPSEGAHLV